jgi:molybdopterin/thiamine biosynthesis adenylyltransferase/ubiquitin-protein ligase
MWWIKDPDRLKKEVADVDAIREREAWLTAATPLLRKDLAFYFSFDITLEGETYGFTLDYPAFFPDAPPMVIPRDSARLSSHQYGAGGEMCLEYRSDNWDPSITGAMLVESTFRLLAAERPGRDARVTVPTAHAASLGQQLRGWIFRFLVTDAFLAYVTQMPVGAYRRATVNDLAVSNDFWTAHVISIGAPDVPDWVESAVPVRRGTKETAAILRVVSLADIQDISDQGALDLMIGRALAAADTALHIDGSRPTFTILADGTAARAFYAYRRDDALKVIAYRSVPLIGGSHSRLPHAHHEMSAKKVGVVGCGSLGSKLAAILARSGVKNFVLVDDDILALGNLVRNELDANSLGIHKVDALDAHLQSLSTNVNISVRRVGLGKQESAGSTASVIDELATCDLLIDATADPQAFNYVAAVARSSMRPMIWAEVYAGGIGGFIARVRPMADPPPHVARQQYLAWCHAKAAPWTSEDREYGTDRTDGASWIADDADVAVIAACASRMALDVLVRPTDSAFPHSAYAIGLSRDWIFQGPHDTHPIDFVRTEEWRSQFSPERTTDAITFMSSLLKHTGHEDTPGS